LASQIPLNRSAYSDRLHACGFADAQARVSAKAVSATLSETVATAAVPVELNAKIDAVDTKIDAVEGSPSRRSTT